MGYCTAARQCTSDYFNTGFDCDTSMQTEICAAKNMICDSSKIPTTSQFDEGGTCGKCECPECGLGKDCDDANTGYTCTDDAQCSTCRGMFSIYPVSYRT